MKRRNDIIVTTGDLKRDYKVLGPVYFQVSNKGLFGGVFTDLRKKYYDEIQAMKKKGTMSEDRADWGFLYGEWSVGQNDFEAAFYIATEELKKRAAMVGADAVICMRQDIDLDTNGFASFYLQMYGTAVKFINAGDSSGANENQINEKKQENVPPKDPIEIARKVGLEIGKNKAGQFAVYTDLSKDFSSIVCPLCKKAQSPENHSCEKCGIPFMYV